MPASRLWTETVSGLGYWSDTETPSFDDALNAYIGAVMKGKADSTRHMPTVQGYTAFIGVDGLVIHSALVCYVSYQRVDYSRAIEELLGITEDSKAEVGFIREDSWEALHEQLPMEVLEDDESDIS